MAHCVAWNRNDPEIKTELWQGNMFAVPYPMGCEWNSRILRRVNGSRTMPHEFAETIDMVMMVMGNKNRDWLQSCLHLPHDNLRIPGIDNQGKAHVITKRPEIIILKLGERLAFES